MIRSFMFGEKLLLDLKVIMMMMMIMMTKTMMKITMINWGVDVGERKWV